MKKSIILFFLPIWLLGCAPLEILRVSGIGTRPFKVNGKIYTRSFNKDLATCYNEVLKILKGMEATPYRGNVKKRFIVALNFHKVFKNKCTDTTEVAIFFKELDSEEKIPRTQVEVSSLNYSLSEFVAQKIFEGLEIGPDIK